MYIYIYIHIYIYTYRYMYFHMYIPAECLSHTVFFSNVALLGRGSHYFMMMMMIAFMNINSCLVPLIEGLCTQILYFRFESISGLRSFAFLFQKKKYVKENKQSVQDFIPPPSIYIYMLVTRIRIHICRDVVHLDSSGPPGVSSRPLGSHPSTPYVQCVCVCVYTHLHPHTLPSALKIEKTKTTPLSFLLS